MDVDQVVRAYKMKTMILFGFQNRFLLFDGFICKLGSSYCVLQPMGIL